MSFFHQPFSYYKTEKITSLWLAESMSIHGWFLICRAVQINSGILIFFWGMKKMNNHIKAHWQAIFIKDLHNLYYLKILSSCNHQKVLQINIICSVNLQLHSRSCSYLPCSIPITSKYEVYKVTVFSFHSFVPYVGMVTILMNDYPKFKVSEFQFCIPMLNFSQLCKLLGACTVTQKVHEILLGNYTLPKNSTCEPIMEIFVFYFFQVGTVMLVWVFFCELFFIWELGKNKLFTGLGTVCKVKNCDLRLGKTSVTVFHYIFKAHSMLLFCREVQFFWCNKKVLLSYIHETCNLQDKIDMYMLWIHLSTLSLSMVGCFILISWLWLADWFCW